MNLTRRNILKALGIGAAVSVSGASIADKVKMGPIKVETHPVIMPANDLIPWKNNVSYSLGEMIKASDGNWYQCEGTSNTPFTIDGIEVI